MIKWGISANSHDGAISVFENNQLLFAGHTERFSKIKNDPDIPANMVRYLKKQWGDPFEVFWYERPISKTFRQLWAGQGWKWSDNNISKYLKSADIHAPVTFVDHHTSHAAAAYYTAPFTDCATLVIDSIGEWDTTSIWVDNNSTPKKIWTRTYPNSLGLFYSAMTQRIGLKPQEDEYILMGMAAYGDPTRLIDRIRNDMWKDNSIAVNLHRGCMEWAQELNTIQDHFDIAAATQKLYEDEFEKLLILVREKTDKTNIALAGGCALNCVANTIASKYFENVWIFPNPGDSGSAIGAVLAHSQKHLTWNDCFWGYDIKREYPVKKILADLLAKKAVGVANGRAEFGPRALGNRSLLADPRTQEMKDKVNNIKKRQQFRPFAPAILEEFADDYFNLNNNTSRFMQYAVKCKQPELIPAAIHHDGTSRVQTVPAGNHGFRLLLEEWYEATGCPVLLNTSLNIKGQPIVNDLVDARAFADTYYVNVY
jgi:carbamoyltransferase